MPAQQILIRFTKPLNLTAKTRARAIAQRSDISVPRPQYWCIQISLHKTQQPIIFDCISYRFSFLFAFMKRTFLTFVYQTRCIEYKVAKVCLLLMLRNGIARAEIGLENACWHFFRILPLLTSPNRSWIIFDIWVGKRESALLLQSGLFLICVLAF